MHCISFLIRFFPPLFRSERSLLLLSTVHPLVSFFFLFNSLLPFVCFLGSFRVSCCISFFVLYFLHVSFPASTVESLDVMVSFPSLFLVFLVLSLTLLLHLHPLVAVFLKLLLSFGVFFRSVFLRFPPSFHCRKTYQNNETRQAITANDKTMLYPSFRSFWLPHFVTF